MKKKLAHFRNVLLFLAVVFIASCGDYGDYGDYGGTGLSQDIQNLIPDSILTVITGLGMPINKGNKPPTLSGTYLASPFILKSSNRPGDFAGQSFSDYEVRFYNFSISALTLTVDYYNGGEQGSGLGSFVSGSGNNFSVFAELNSTYNNHPAKLVHIISGTLTATGISNLHFANIMINNFGNPDGTWIENGQGRVIYDSDGNSPKTGQPKSYRNTYSGRGSGAGN
jgi:hypothetical protein